MINGGGPPLREDAGTGEEEATTLVVFWSVSTVPRMSTLVVTFCGEAAMVRCETACNLANCPGWTSGGGPPGRTEAALPRIPVARLGGGPEASAASSLR